MTPEQEAISKRIYKLFKLSETAQASGSLTEAESALAKARRLLLEYNLTEDQVFQDSELDKKYKCKVIRLNTVQNKNEGREFALLIAQHIAKANLCDMIVINLTEKEAEGFPHDTGIGIVGSELNIQLVGMMIYQYIDTIRTIGKQKRKEMLKEDDNPNTFMRSFLYGAAVGLGSRMQQEKRLDTNEETGLVLNNRSSLNKFIETLVPHTKTGEMKQKEITFRDPGDPMAYLAGYKTGRETPLSDRKALE